MQSEGFWLWCIMGSCALSIVRNSKYRKHKTSESGSVSILGRCKGDTYSVGSLRKSLSQTLAVIVSGTEHSRCLLPLTWRRKQNQVPKRPLFYSFRISDDGQSAEAQCLWPNMGKKIFTFSPNCKLLWWHVRVGLWVPHPAFCIDFCFLSDRILKVSVGEEWGVHRGSPYQSQVNGSNQPSAFSAESSIHTYIYTKLN
jgi:hypothetical protein